MFIVISWLLVPIQVKKGYHPINHNKNTLIYSSLPRMSERNYLSDWALDVSDDGTVRII